MSRMIARVVLLGVLTSVLVVDPSMSWLPLRPMDTDVTTTPLAFAAEEPGTDELTGLGVWTSEELDVGATVTGVTWDDPDAAPAVVEFRARIDGTWSRWQEAHVEDDHLPDPGSPEASAARGGTPPLVVAGSDAVQFRVADETEPAGLAAMVVDVDDPDGARREATPLAAEAGPPRPSIRSRDAWSADSCVRRDRDDASITSRVQVLFVHHTAGHTSYGSGDVAGIVNGICSYHVSGLGWSDIGYNALVDRFGRVWEGRAGGLERGVIGAHTGGFNSYSTGVALIGDHHTGGAPSTAAQDGLVEYAAWKLSLHGIDPLARTSIVSGGSSRWSAGTRVTFDAIAGHRDASATACPGDLCFGLLPRLRQRVDAALALRMTGGRAQQRVYEPAGSAWPDVTATARFNASAAWTATITDASDGRVVHRATGRGESMRLTWSPAVDGTPVAKGSYRLRVSAQRLSDGDRAGRSSTFSLYGPRSAFTDVPAAHTFVDDIGQLATAGVTRGCSPPMNLRYCPAASVTRGQMAAFLARALGLPRGTTTFRDTRGHVFQRDVAAIADAGITTGCGGSRFCPDEPITRAEMAAFLDRALDLPSGSGRFVDTDGHLFAANIAAIADAGITVGCNPPANDRFCPQDPVTREQMAAFLVRAGLAR